MSRNENCVGPADEPVRCSWAGSDPLYRAYHDTEWGVPSRDERHLFEMLNLEGAQAGLSWITILKKRENYRAAFDGFDPEKIARYDDAQGGVAARRCRHRAQPAEGGGDDRQRAGLPGAARERPDVRRRGLGAVRRHAAPEPDSLHGRGAGEDARSPTRCRRSCAKLGFKFVGSTIVYAYLQAVGCVNDHLVDLLPARRGREAALRPCVSPSRAPSWPPRDPPGRGPASARRGRGLRSPRRGSARPPGG